MSEKLPFDGLTEDERKKKRLEQWNRRMHDFDQLRNEYIWHMKQRDDFLDAVKNQKKRIGQLEAENAKLRKLLGKYHYTLLAFQDDEEEEGNHSPCPLYVCPDTTMCPWDNAPCPFVEAIKELGIEAEQ